jgi:hypothetical protein
VSRDCCPYCGHKKLEKEVGGFDFIFYGLTVEGKSMPLLKFFCCLDVYLKLYLRLKFLVFHNHFFLINYMFCLGLVVLFAWIL